MKKFFSLLTLAVAIGGFSLGCEEKVETPTEEAATPEEGETTPAEGEAATPAEGDDTAGASE